MNFNDIFRISSKSKSYEYFEAQDSEIVHPRPNSNPKTVIPNQNKSPRNNESTPASTAEIDCFFGSSDIFDDFFESY
jgi:hypothetical protein